MLRKALRLTAVVAPAQSADFAREADEVMYSERDRLRTSLLSGVTVLQIHHALGIYSNWLQARVSCAVRFRVTEPG